MADHVRMTQEERKADLMRRLRQPAYITDPDILQYLIDIGFDINGPMIYGFEPEFTLAQLIHNLGLAKPPDDYSKEVMVSPELCNEYFGSYGLFVTMLRQIFIPMSQAQRELGGNVPGWYFEGQTCERFSAPKQDLIRCFVTHDFRKGYLQEIAQDVIPPNVRS